MKIAMKGLVSAARDIRERISAGMAPSEKQTFIGKVRFLVDSVDRQLRERRATENALSPASGQALRILRSIASMTPAQIPDPRDGLPGSTPFSITNVESLLRMFRTVAGQGAMDGSVRTLVRRRLAEKAEAVEAICRRRSTTPSCLLDRTRKAYGMVKWLCDEGNFDLYLAQVCVAAGAIARVSAQARPELPREASVAFVQGPSVYRMKTGRALQDWQFSTGFLDAEDADFEAVARMVLCRGRKPDAVKARYVAFVDSPDFNARDMEIDAMTAGGAYRSAGRVYDLGALFDSVNSGMFGGAVGRPKLHWLHCASRSVFGTYCDRLDLVCVNSMLDDPGVPKWFVEFILFHELLHKKHGFERRGRKRVWHSAEFRREEKSHPRWAEAKEMTALLSRRAASKNPAPT